MPASAASANQASPLLSARQHDERGRERAERRAEIAADLEQGLGEAMRAAGRETGDARGFRMEDRGTKPEQHARRQAACA